jgi:ligand-binding SRPBCC domain-containing protein
VFSFFANAHNLDAITPDWLHFKVLTDATLEIQKGANIEYNLRLHGWKLRWQSEITIWNPPYQFTDVQRKGPYKLWIHEHKFAENDNGTLVEDVVNYAVPGSIFEPIIHRFLILPDLRKIFEHRRRKLSEIFGCRDPIVGPQA